MVIVQSNSRLGRYLDGPDWIIRFTSLLKLSDGFVTILVPFRLCVSGLKPNSLEVLICR